MRVLVVEDEATVAEGVRRGLEGEGFTVVVAHDGAEGLALASTGTFDLVILDILLPSQNGYSVCRDLRATGDLTPVIMLTAKSGEFDEAEGLELGADDFLSKPFSMVVLLARVRALLRRPQRRIEWPAVGELRLDPLRRRCYRGETPIALTARETEVLAALMARPGQLVTKAELLGAVWGEEFSGDVNIVEVYISHLRRKVDGAGQPPLVETVRGEGYRLRGPSDRVS
ncbi:MAG TPA: response regulator transcription factor [Acidimicrobiales bacterium]|jgi:DNA-binding response OmpR family regulator|nr:response regulator transcription factor [Acidimicrobiales bacterium]